MPPPNLYETQTLKPSTTNVLSKANKGNLKHGCQQITTYNMDVSYLLVMGKWYKKSISSNDFEFQKVGRRMHLMIIVNNLFINQE